MKQSFFPRIWRGNPISLADNELEALSIGEGNIEKMELKCIDFVEHFIRSIFNYDNIKVSITRRKKKTESYTNFIEGKLEEGNGHLIYRYATEIYNRLLIFNIENIPATKESLHIEVFFNVLGRFLNHFYEILNTGIKESDSRIVAVPEAIERSEIWLYNIERTVIVEYIYHLFNSYDNKYSSVQGILPKPLRYNIDFINKIIDVAYELNTKKVENKEIHCGFIFHDNETEVQMNSKRSIEIIEKIKFGDFGKLKNILEISNGQNIFFNVTNEKITHIFITRDNVNEIRLDPLVADKTFISRPLILSIQGNGKIYFLEGRTEQNRSILQITNSKPIIRDNAFIKQFIQQGIIEFIGREIENTDIFVKWIMSLSQKKHGTSLIFHDMSTSPPNKKLVKTTEIKINYQNLLNDDYSIYDIALLNNLTNPDGAIIFNKNLTPTNIATILPVKQATTNTGGGSRHNSVLSFTKELNCYGIVISEDGPITIFKEGKSLIKF